MRLFISWFLLAVILTNVNSCESRTSPTPLRITSSSCFLALDDAPGNQLDVDLSSSDGLMSATKRIEGVYDLSFVIESRNAASNVVGRQLVTYAIHDMDKNEVLIPLVESTKLQFMGVLDGHRIWFNPDELTLFIDAGRELHLEQFIPDIQEGASRIRSSDSCIVVVSPNFSKKSFDVYAFDSAMLMHGFSSSVAILTAEIGLDPLLHLKPIVNVFDEGEDLASIQIGFLEKEYNSRSELRLFKYMWDGDELVNEGHMVLALAIPDVLAEASLWHGAQEILDQERRSPFRTSGWMRLHEIIWKEREVWLASASFLAVYTIGSGEYHLVSPYDVYGEVDFEYEWPQRGFHYALTSDKLFMVSQASAAGQGDLALCMIDLR